MGVMEMVVQKEDQVGEGRMMYLSGQEALDILVMVNQCVVIFSMNYLKAVMRVTFLLKVAMLMSMAIWVALYRQLNIRSVSKAQMAWEDLVVVEWVSNFMAHMIVFSSPY